MMSRDTGGRGGGNTSDRAGGRARGARRSPATPPWARRSLPARPLPPGPRTARSPCPAPAPTRGQNALSRCCARPTARLTPPRFPLLSPPFPLRPCGTGPQRSPSGSRSPPPPPPPRATRIPPPRDPKKVRSAAPRSPFPPLGTPLATASSPITGHNQSAPAERLQQTSFKQPHLTPSKRSRQRLPLNSRPPGQVPCPSTPALSRHPPTHGGTGTASHKSRLPGEAVRLRFPGADRCQRSKFQNKEFGNF